MEDFVNIWKSDSKKVTPKDSATGELKGGFYDKWLHETSAKVANPLQAGSDALSRLYPDYSIVATADYQLNILNFPGIIYTPLDDMQMVTESVYFSFARNEGIPGTLGEVIHVGGFKLLWEKHEFLLFQVAYPSGFGMTTVRYILHHGPDGPARLLLLSIGAWANQLHNEIWVFDNGYWSKDHSLWSQIQKARWEDVILKADFKKALQKDIYGFFDSKEIYEELAIPWKRGLIMHGPPGNGKTISIKTIMKTCEDKGFLPLYVKSFKSYMGEERSMSEVFNHARNMAPCVLILEDLDSLINDSNRSFFLNQLDGLSENNGLLLIGTTNHFDRLDPGLSSRPSRFDRKYKFDDPDLEGRMLYAQYWQNKLKRNDSIDFPDDLLKRFAQATDGFSFAYLKEAFVSTLVGLANYDGDDKPSFADAILKTVKTLRKELDRPSPNGFWLNQYRVPGQTANPESMNVQVPGQQQRHNTHPEQPDFRRVLDPLVRGSGNTWNARTFIDAPLNGASQYGPHSLSHLVGDRTGPTAQTARFEPNSSCKYMF